jgi:hypothetical protein
MTQYICMVATRDQYEAELEKLALAAETLWYAPSSVGLTARMTRETTGEQFDAEATIETIQRVLDEVRGKLRKSKQSERKEDVYG